MDYGWTGLKKRQSDKPNNNFIYNLAKDINNILIIARVTDIVLDNKHPDFVNLGEWNGLGIIKYETIDKRIQTFSGYAKPIDFVKFPLINELVYIITAYNTNIEQNPYEVSSYYVNTINIWNHPHHNGYPNNDILPPSQQKDYTQTQIGNVRRVSDNSTEINLGKTFKERANIHPLLHFEGDVMNQGRWGNSFRLGSTVSSTPNNWSSTGNNGDPIILIRNGQGNQSDQGWVPITENINNDDSSLYLTSTQNIPLNASSTSYVSYNKDKTPTSPNKFTGSQIVLSSGRLMFNAKNDHILLSSAKSINLNSLESVNIDSPNFIVQSNKIFLGKNDASEPLMLGNQTNEFLKELVSSLKAFMTVASEATTAPCVEGSSVSLPSIQISANNVLAILNKLEDSLNKKDLTSNTSYTTK